jgi:type VI secretion system protein ImpC
MENAAGPYREAATDGAVGRAIVEIDRKLTAQLDEILHHPEFLKLESAWRGLKFLVDRIDFRETW